jgi:hypothetical protein
MIATCSFAAGEWAAASSATIGAIAAGATARRRAAGDGGPERADPVTGIPRFPSRPGAVRVRRYTDYLDPSGRSRQDE